MKLPLLLSPCRQSPRQTGMLPILRCLASHSLRLTLGSWLCLAFLGWLSNAAIPARAELIPDNCEICQIRFFGTIYKLDDPVRNVTRYYCPPCAQATNDCWACDLPMPQDRVHRLKDGRILCPWDSKGIIVDPLEARYLAQTHIREWQNMLSPWPPFPQDNVQVHLLDQEEFTREYRRRPQTDHPDLLRGLCYSNKGKDGKPEHHIYVLSGLLRNQFLAVCAHEYAHAWLYEHETPQRILHKDTEEGFCEWIALRYMIQLGDTVEQHRLRSSEYTAGQLEAFEAAEKEYQFYNVMQWVLQGVDSWIDIKELRQLLALRNDAPSTPTTKALQAATAPAPPRIFIGKAIPTPVPDTLELKGLSYSQNRSFVLINNQTLMEGERAKVRVGDSSKMVRCLEIRKDAALIQLEGEAEPRLLKWSPK